ncbi:MAG TPA: amidohydrolase family protein [Terriglobales bacterium]|nr:amidohydrolase family protein [Terriglobales bacterium]
MKTHLLTLAALAALAGAVAAQSTPKVLFVRTGTLIYDTQQPPMAHGDVVITNGTITAVGPGLAPPAGARVLDLSQQTVMPSLLDAHTHLATSLPGAGPGAVPSTALSALLGSQDVAYAQDSGVAAMRVLGSSGFIDVALGNAIDAGVIRGPHIIPAAHAISIPGGHADFFTLPPSMPLQSYYTPLNGFINSTADAEQAVHLQVKYGAKVIKIMASGGVLSPLDLFTSEQLTPEEMRKIVEVAHGDHLKVAAHDENLKAIMDALHAGVDSIEHGSDLDQQAVDYMNAHHQVLDATLYVVDNILQNGERMHMSPYSLLKAHQLAAKHFASFQLALRSGVRMAAGSDQAYAPGTGTIYNEAVSEVNHGASPQLVLTDATRHNAALLGLPQLGTIAVGKEGDLVAMPGNPLDDIHALSHLTAIVYQGKIIRAPANQ